MMQIELSSHLPGRGNAESAAAAIFFLSQEIFISSLQHFPFILEKPNTYMLYFYFLKFHLEQMTFLCGFF